jgi:predicted RNase H-like nuclease (RuvC/YqgF family)
MPSKTDLLRRERDDQRKLADHWKLQHDDYKKLNAKLAARSEDLEAEVTRLTAENEQMRAVLENIRARRYQNRETVSPENAFAAFGRLNTEVCAIYAECDAALSGDKQ